MFSFSEYRALFLPHKSPKVCLLTKGEVVSLEPVSLVLGGLSYSGFRTATTLFDRCCHHVCVGLYWFGLDRG